MAQPFAHGRFSGGFGRNILFTLREETGNASGLTTFYWDVAPYDYNIVADWIWTGRSDRDLRGPGPSWLVSGIQLAVRHVRPSSTWEVDSQQIPHWQVQLCTLAGYVVRHHI